MFRRFTAPGRWDTSQLGVKLQHRWIIPRNSDTRSYSSRNVYHEAFRKAGEKPELFWSEAAQKITWFQRWTKTLDCTDKVFPKW